MRQPRSKGAWPPCAQIKWCCLRASLILRSHSAGRTHSLHMEQLRGRATVARCEPPMSSMSKTFMGQRRTSSSASSPRIGSCSVTSGWKR